MKRKPQQPPALPADAPENVRGFVLALFDPINLDWGVVRWYDGPFGTTPAELKAMRREMKHYWDVVNAEDPGGMDEQGNPGAAMYGDGLTIAPVPMFDKPKDDKAT